MTNLILIGPMGAGKSTIGRLLSKELQLVFKDCDREIESRSGADIPWIFDVEGEQGFRDREHAMLMELCGTDGLVIATGGGAVMREENRRLLRKAGKVVYLFTSVACQLERTFKDKGRPLLHSSDPGKVLCELMAVRDPLYRELADIIVTTDQRTPRSVVQEIVRNLQKHTAEQNIR